VRIGSVVAEDRETLVPLPDGPTVVIVEAETGKVTHLPNPAQGLAQGRRAAVTRLFIEHGVQVVLSVPGAFCEHSHGLAKANGLHFVPVAEGTRLSQVLADLPRYLQQRTSTLPPGMLFVALDGAHAPTGGQGGQRA